MDALNYKHLRYFWMVAKTGSMARAAEKLHLAPQSISGQLGEFESRLGVKLFQPVGRKRELTDAGRRVLSYAEEIFAIGDELLDVLRDQRTRKTLLFRVGIADSVSKRVAYQLIEPALSLGEPVRLVCREGSLGTLMADLAIHRLDMIIADRPLPADFNVRGFCRPLSRSPVSVLGTPALASRHGADFPSSLDGAPLLLPGEDAALLSKLVGWLEASGLHPQIVGEFDDSALMKAFGQAGAGLFVAPTAIVADVCAQYGVVELGRLDSVVEEWFAITSQRRLTHPAVLAISQAKFGEPSPAGRRARRT